MFGFGKRKEAGADVVPATIEEELGLREYVSVDSLKAHLVDLVEENRKLKQQAEENGQRQRRQQDEDRKQRELLTITADEWKKRAGEKDGEIKKLKAVIDDQDRKIENLEKEQNYWKAEAEMASTAAVKAQKEAANQKECARWLKDMVEKHGNWKEYTKMQLVEVIKTAIGEKEEKE